jgi:hypothetical protein
MGRPCDVGGGSGLCMLDSHPFNQQTHVMVIGHVASCLGKGLLAGVAGTAVMTMVTTIEMNVRGREASSAPSDAAGKVLGVQPRNPQGRARFSNVVHWAYGTAWGGARGLLAATGVKGPGADAAHFAVVWGSALVMLPALNVAPRPDKWGWDELALDAFHHIVYSAATGIAYRLIDEN